MSQKKEEAIQKVMTDFEEMANLVLKDKNHVTKKRRSYTEGHDRF